MSASAPETTSATEAPPAAGPSAGEAERGVSGGVGGKRDAEERGGDGSGDVKKARASGDWFGAAGDGGAARGVSGKARALPELLRSADTQQSVSSVKSKLSRPKDGGSRVGAAVETARKERLSASQVAASQARHRERLEALGKPVPHYMKGQDKR